MKPTYEELQDKCAALAADNEKAMEAIGLQESAK